jgi:hypothetical protein
MPSGRSKESERIVTERKISTPVCADIVNMLDEKTNTINKLRSSVRG